MTEHSYCPVVDYQYFMGPDPAGTNFARLDEAAKAHGPFFRTEEAQGYWVFTEYGAILDGLQHPKTFSSRVMAPIEPNPPYKRIPVILDPPVHAKWRQLLAQYFSPRRVKQAEAQHRAYAVELIEKLKDSGRCDFYTRIRRGLSRHHIPAGHGPFRRQTRPLHGVGIQDPAWQQRKRPSPQDRGGRNDGSGRLLHQPDR